MNRLIPGRPTLRHFMVMGMAWIVCVMPPMSVAEVGSSNVKNLSAQEAKDYLNENPTTLVLDVRTKVEFDEGHLDDAINIDYFASDFTKRVAMLNSDETYLVHCRSGVRSTKALTLLKEAGFRNLLHLDGGINAWRKNELQD